MRMWRRVARKGERAAAGWQRAQRCGQALPGGTWLKVNVALLTLSQCMFMFSTALSACTHLRTGCRIPPW